MLVFYYFHQFSSSTFIPAGSELDTGFPSLCFSPTWKTFYCWLHHDVFLAAQTGKHLLRTQNVSEQNQKLFLCPGQNMFLNKIRNFFCVRDTKFVSATNVAHEGKRGNICVSNHVSATMHPHLPGF